MAALLIGLLVTAQGIAGLAAPESFANLIRAIQVPPLLYGAAAVRVAFGVVLILAAPFSRTPRALRVIGAVIGIGGLLTPFIGVQIAQVILESWANPAVVRAWASFSLLLGAFIVYTTSGYRRRAAA